jgi:hypothetical protein
LGGSYKPIFLQSHPIRTGSLTQIDGEELDYIEVDWKKAKINIRS